MKTLERARVVVVTGNELEHSSELVEYGLLEAAIAAYRDCGGRELFLESSSKLAPALRLYESAGFRHRPAPRPGSHYARADVYMVWEPGAA